MSALSSTGVTSGTAVRAVPQLPEPGVPKRVGNVQVSTPTMFTTSRPDTGSPIRDTDRAAANIDLTTYRTVANTKEMVAVYAKVNPELAAAIDVYVRLGLTGYTVIARDRLSNDINSDATNLAWSWLRQNDAMGDYAAGFSINPTVRAVLESLAVELRIRGGCALELVLNKARQPWRLAPIGTANLEWYPDPTGKTVLPKQKIGSDSIDLNIATFYYASLDQSLYTPHSESPMEAALQPILMNLQFINDVRKVIRSVLHPRIKVVIDEKSLREHMPVEAQSTAEGAIKWRDAVITAVVERLNGVEPEEAFVFLSSVTAEFMDRGNTSLGAEYEIIEKISSGKISSGAKTLPSVIGKGASTGTASTESMIFLKQVEGAIQAPLNEVMSKALTMICRLAGQDVYVDFKLDDINLRPKMELQAFEGQKQARVLEQLSIGLITDIDAAIALTGKLPPSTMSPRSGTMFYKADASVFDTGEDGVYQGGSGPGADGGGGPLAEQLKSKAPAGKAGDNKKRVV